MIRVRKWRQNCTGVSTIAGGYSQSLQPVGHEDGPAQTATFSTDFEIAFVAEECALLVSDHGNQLIRKINLKPEDCTTKSSPGIGGASIMIWAVGLGLSCLIGIVFGIVIRPYIIGNTGRFERQPLHADMEALPNPSGESSSDSLLRHQKHNC